jgi:DNA-binding response OmpR family regulator
MDRQFAGRLLESEPRYHVEYASDGLEALELVESKLPLALVTDMQMPGMDGLELITTMHRRFPTVPIIMMTAVGSEDIAFQALASGAADYVPKSHLVAGLRKAVDGVLAITAGDRAHQRLSKYLRFQELHYDLDCDMLLIPPLVDELEQTAAEFGLVDASDRVQLAKALVESLRNAACHGDRERVPGPAQPAGDSTAHRKGQIHVHAVFYPDEARFTIRDEGPGFDINRVPDVAADPSQLLDGGGHGLVLIRMFMDEVFFNSAGNEITMIKRRRDPGETDADKMDPGRIQGDTTS